MPRLGAKAKAYFLSTGTRATWGTADATGVHVGAAPSNLTEMASVQDVSIDGARGSVEATTRGDGWETVLATLPALPVSFSIRYSETDATFLALLKAWINGTVFAAAFLDQASTVVGAIGFWADWEVLDLKKGEKLKEAQMYNVTLAPSAQSAVPPEVVKVSSGS